jgi:hypothetical protein
MSLPMVQLPVLVGLTLLQETVFFHLCFKYKTGSITTNEALCFRRFPEQDENFF